MISRTLPRTTRPNVGSAIRLAALSLLLVATVTVTLPAADNTPVAMTRTESQGPVDVKVTLDKDTAQVAEPLTLTLTVDAPQDVLVTLPQQPKTLGTFNVLSMVETADIPTANGRQWIRRYEVESLVPGEQTLPSIAIAYSDRREAAPSSSTASHDVVETPALHVAITSVLEGTPDPMKFRDIKDVVDMPVTDEPSHTWLVWSIGSGAALALAGVALLVWPGRSSRRSAKDRALAELADLQQSNLLEQGLTEQYYVRLTTIVRQYIENQFGIAAPKLTTEEFLDQTASSSRLDDGQRGTLRVFLSLADLVKFAQFQPGQDDAHQAIQRATQFIEQSAIEKKTNPSSEAAKENA